MLGHVDQRLDVFVQESETKIQGYAHQVEKLFNHDACDVRQQRKQTNHFSRAERESMYVNIWKKKKPIKIFIEKLRVRKKHKRLNNNDIMRARVRIMRELTCK